MGISFLHNLNKFRISLSDFVIDKIIELKTFFPYIFCNSGISFNKASKSKYSLPTFASTIDVFCLISNETPWNSNFLTKLIKLTKFLF